MLRPDGEELTLRWSAEWEAYYYESFYPDTWADIPRLDPSLPILIVGGSTSDTYLPEAAALLREGVPWATHARVEGYGHLFPQSAPDVTGRILRSWIETL
jgi:pimeloyl-ACP methyl ester carboxylesterase